MLNPMIRWEPGQLVRYHGSHPDLCDGVYRVHPCTCLRCDDPVYGSARYRLVDGAGRTVVSCVRARSITAAFEETPAEAARYDRYWFDRDED